MQEWEAHIRAIEERGREEEAHEKTLALLIEAYAEKLAVYSGTGFTKFWLRVGEHLDATGSMPAARLEAARMLRKERESPSGGRDAAKADFESYH